VTNLDITTTSEVDYYTFTTPSGTGNTFTVNVQSSGLSLLSPKVTVYAADQTTVLATVSGLNQDGTTLTATIKNSGTNQRYYVMVQGADTTAFSSGKYALSLNFGGGATPVAPSAVMPIANGNPLSGGGELADSAGSSDDFLDSVPVVTGISQDTGQSSNDGVTKDATLFIEGVAPEGYTVKIYNNGQLIGSTTAGLNLPNVLGLATVVNSTLNAIGLTTSVKSTWEFDNTGTTLADGTYTLTALTVGPSGDVSAMSNLFTVIVDTKPPAAPTISGINPNDGNGLLNVSSPTLTGTALPSSQVTISRDNQVIGTTFADGQGTWSYTDNSSITAGTYAYAYTATAADLAGNVSTPSNSSRVVIGGSPAPTTSTPTLVQSKVVSLVLGLLNANSTPTLNGTATVGSIITLIDGNIILGTTTTDASGNWTFTSPAFKKGSHSISAEATNAQGVTGLLSGSLTVTV
jgi:hypothetical protein